MVKKKKIEKVKALNFKTKQKINRTKKYSIKITSKTKKKLKTTTKKLSIDKGNLSKIISYLINCEKLIKSQEFKIQENHDNKSNDGSSIFLFISLKRQLKEEEIKKIKNKLIRIKYPMINNNNHLCLITDDLMDKEKEELISISNSNIDIFEKEKLKKIIKDSIFDSNSSLDNKYQICVIVGNNISPINKYCDVIYLQHKNYELIKNIIQKIIKGATLLKIHNKNNNILKIKIGYTNMKKEELIDNAYRLIFKTVAFVLTYTEKYNGIENVIFKTSKSIPFQLYGNIKPEDINSYE